MNRILSFFLFAALLSGCASGVKIDRSKSAFGQESRAQFLILHYTALDLAKSLKVLTEQSVSSHYLVADDAEATVYQLVDENRMAYHSGLSDWKGFSRLNPSSIGIEIVNLGYTDTPEGRVYYPFPQHQIDQVIRLVKEIAARHQIRPEYILGHAEIAPQRKSDPGPLFPWKQFADAGLIPWPSADQVAEKQVMYELAMPEVTWFQKRLAQHGYLTPQTGVWDEATKNVLIAFQARYRPSNFSGVADAQTAAILDVLTSPKNSAAPKK